MHEVHLRKNETPFQLFAMVEVKFPSETFLSESLQINPSETFLFKSLQKSKFSETFLSLFKNISF